MKVAILWHMHQPSYREADIGRSRYPWAFLHAARHYHMMGLIAKAHPETAMTINVTPVLMEQLDDYTRDDFKDRLLDVVRMPADSLEREDQALLVDHVFKLHYPTMIAPFPRYRELKNILDGTGAKKVRVEEIRDLQVLYLLTWTGPHLRRMPEISEVFKKGRGFTEREKEVVFGICHDAVREVLPLYRELADGGSVEISTTPYYHPILPLIMDCEAARESKPHVELNGVAFHYPQDARWHVEEAIRAYEGRFGRPPQGMWPAEGSVSGPALELLASAGLRWAATDEGVLSRSIHRFPLSEEERHRPYVFGEGDILVYFRDHEISDRIGFVYSSWNPERAADDLIGRLLGIRGRLGRKESEACVSIILDGENPWEHYPDSGIGFLSRFYQLLADTPGLESVRLGDPSMRERDRQRLQSVVPGSWIDANFDTWIGVPEKNHAWKCLSSARQKLAVEAPGTPVPREFYRAEGSDWFWWLGPGHDTPYEASYENLFRTNLLEGLRKAGIEAPEILKSTARIISTPTFQPPLHLFSPRVNGKRGNYYEWIAAGFYRSSEGSTHRASRLLEQLRFGFDRDTFYLRVEGDLEAVRKANGDVSLGVEILRPLELDFTFAGGCLTVVRGGDGRAVEAPARQRSESRGKAAIGDVVEVGLPLEELGARSGQALDFAVSLRVGLDLIERLPRSGYVCATVPSPDYGRENWSV